jgi:hypothetical protein
MAFMFQRGLAIPLWAIAFFTVALTAPPSATLSLMALTTVFAMVAVGIGAILFLAPGALTWLRASPLLVRVVPAGYQEPPRRRIAGEAGSSVRKLDKPSATEADDALDLVRMDDDGGWQMTRPPA